MKSESSTLQFSIDPGTVYISTNPDQSSYANITVTVTNTGTESISVNTIAITLPAALAPGSTLGSITPVASNPKLWGFGASGIYPGEFDAIAQNGDSVPFEPGDSFAFTLQLVTLVSVITQPVADITVLVTLGDGYSGEPVLLPVNVKTAVASIQSFNSNIADISPGESAILKWNCPGISYCVISPVGSGHFDAVGTHQVSPEVTTVYTLYAYADGVILSAQWAISVDNVQVVLFAGAQGQTKVNLGDSINLVWICNQYASGVKLTADTDVSIPELITGSNTPQKGNVTTGPIEQQTQFTFTAYAGTNFAQSETTISINNVTVTLSASPTTDLWMGDKITFSWNIESASEVSFYPEMENGPSLQKLAGSEVYDPGMGVATMLCNLTASGYINNAPGTTSNKPPVELEFQQVSIDSFLCSPAVITPDSSPGNQAGLEWAMNAQLASIDNGIGDATTSRFALIISPVNGTVYTLTAGSKQNPAQLTQQVTIVNAFGPYTFNNFAPNVQFPYLTDFFIPDPGPLNELQQWFSGGYTAVITGVDAINWPADFLALASYNTQYVSKPAFSVCNWPYDPLSAPIFSWSDPNVQTGTITLISRVYPPKV